MSDENINPDAPLHIRGLNHLTIPVKDRYRAARFYIVALGAEAHHESAPDRVAKGLIAIVAVRHSHGGEFRNRSFRTGFWPAGLEPVPPSPGPRHLRRRSGEMGGAFQKMADSLRRSDDSIRHQRRGDLLSTIPTAIISKSIVPTSPMINGANTPSAPTTRACACTNKNGRPKSWRTKPSGCSKPRSPACARAENRTELRRRLSQTIPSPRRTRRFRTNDFR